MADISGGDATLFEEAFTIDDIDKSKYARCARLFAKSTDLQTELQLDINTDVFPCTVGETLHIVMSTTLALDGSKEEDKGWRDLTKGKGDVATLADMFDYVCYGKIYKFEDGDDGQFTKAYVSFGGLLMYLNGPYEKLTPLRVEYVYLLIKK